MRRTLRYVTHQDAGLFGGENVPFFADFVI